MNDATARTGETVEDALGRLLAWPTKRVRRDAAILRSRVAELEAALGRALRLADWYAHRLGEHPKDCQWCQMAVEQQDALAGDGGGPRYGCAPGCRADMDAGLHKPECRVPPSGDGGGA